jgi:uncharacterized protein
MRMLLQFRFENFLSYREETEFFMTASPIKERFLEENLNPIVNLHGEEILKVAGVFGANGSGKSNLLKAFKYAIGTILGKTSNQFWQNFQFATSNPFLLDDYSKDEPAHFELIVLIDEIVYRYGFVIQGTIILEEWLYRTQKRETKIFKREKQIFEINGEEKILKELDKKGMIREDSLFLTTSAKFNDQVSRQLISSFESYIFFDSYDINSYLLGSSLSHRILEKQFSNKLIEILQSADINIEGIEFQKLENAGSLSFLDSKIAKDYVYTIRKIFNKEGESIGERKFKMSEFESEGTRKFFDIAIVLIQILEKGGVLFIDEMDVKIHPLLFQLIIKIFLDESKNPNHSQLIFSTHNISILDEKLLRRDQIYLCDKDKTGVSSLISLSEFKTPEGKGIRNDESIVKNYLRGKYGAIPLLS